MSNSEFIPVVSLVYSVKKLIDFESSKKIKPISKEFPMGALGYSLFLSGAVAMIPILILGQVAGIVTIEDCELWFDTEENPDISNEIRQLKYDKCIEALPMVESMVTIVAPIFSVGMFLIAFSGLFTSLVNGYVKDHNRSPVEGDQ